MSLKNAKSNTCFQTITQQEDLFKTRYDNKFKQASKHMNCTAKCKFWFKSSKWILFASRSSVLGILGGAKWSQLVLNLLFDGDLDSLTLHQTLSGSSRSQ